MTEHPRTSNVQLLEVGGIRLIEAVAPPVPPEERAVMNRAWDEAVAANPSLFDGPVVACTGLGREGQNDLLLTWVRTTFRSYVLRLVPGASSLPSLFVAIVQPTDGGRLLIGRMSASTASPGRWQLPGGSVEPPEDDEPLDMSALRRHAARELVEETGIDTAPDDLALWLVTRGDRGNTGVVFLAPHQPESVIRHRFAALLSSEATLGRDPELDQIAFLRSGADLAQLEGPQVDYLDPILHRYARATPVLDS